MPEVLFHSFHLLTSLSLFILLLYSFYFFPAFLFSPSLLFLADLAKNYTNEKRQKRIHDKQIKQKEKKKRKQKKHSKPVNKGKNIYKVKKKVSKGKNYITH